MFACIATKRNDAPEALLQLAFGFSPRVEPVSDYAVLLDIDGLDHLVGPPERVAQAIASRAAELRMSVNVAVAQNTAAALVAARGMDGITLIPPGEEQNTLSPLPLELLPATPEIKETWKLWGLRSLGDLAALPENGLAERLGTEGARLYRIARGVETRPLIPVVPAPNFEASHELEYPVELLEPLCFILASLLNQICAGLAARGKGASHLHLRLQLDGLHQSRPSASAHSSTLAHRPERQSNGDGAANCSQTPGAYFERSLSLPVPLCDGMALLKLLQLDLEAHPPGAPVVAVHMRAEAAPPRAVQSGLFLPPAPEPGKLEITLARLAKLVGEGNTGSPELLDTHRPDSFAIRPFRIFQQLKNVRRPLGHGFSHAGPQSPINNFRTAVGQSAAQCSYFFSACSGSRPLACRIFRPPLWAEVQCSGEKPVSIRARGIRGKIVSSAGPWRSSGDWWTADPWQREEWDIQIDCRPTNITAPEVRCWPSAAEAAFRDSVIGTVKTVPLRQHESGFASRSGAGLYRIYRELRTGAWYAEASYD